MKQSCKWRPQIKLWPPMVAIGSAAHMGSAITPKRGYFPQHSRRGVRCQSEADDRQCALSAWGDPLLGRALVLRTEPGKPVWALRASIPVAETAKACPIRSTGVEPTDSATRVDQCNHYPPTTVDALRVQLGVVS